MNCHQCIDKRDEVRNEDCSLLEKVGARLLAGAMLAGLAALLLSSINA